MFRMQKQTVLQFLPMLDLLSAAICTKTFFGQDVSSDPAAALTLLCEVKLPGTQSKCSFESKGIVRSARSSRMSHLATF